MPPLERLELGAVPASAARAAPDIQTDNGVTQLMVEQRLQIRDQAAVLEFLSHDDAVPEDITGCEHAPLRPPAPCQRISIEIGTFREIVESQAAPHRCEIRLRKHAERERVEPPFGAPKIKNIKLLWSIHGGFFECVATPNCARYMRFGKRRSAPRAFRLDPYEGSKSPESASNSNE